MNERLRCTPPNYLIHLFYRNNVFGTEYFVGLRRSDSASATNIVVSLDEFKSHCRTRTSGVEAVIVNNIP